jgi:ABC-type proline/glycine betaine transport system permease subunit
VLADVRGAFRQLRKAPGVTVTAIVTLTLGIGATTAIFTLVHQVMLEVVASSETGRALEDRR